MDAFYKIDPVFAEHATAIVDETIRTYSSRPDIATRRASSLRRSPVRFGFDVWQVSDVALCAVRALRRDGEFGEFSDVELLAMVEARTDS